jgi:serine phosphatase RsbU (regulator of sigma subunit)
VVADPRLTDITENLTEGDTWMLYTDGITEAGAPERLLDAPDLIALAERCTPASAAEVAACLERAAVEASDGDPHDDIAIVVLRVTA